MRAALLAVVLAVAAPAVRAEPSRFVKITHTLDGQPQYLQTAIEHLQSPAGNLTVDLIPVVHFAAPDYYALLNQRFARYDAVLYEMVGPDDPEDPQALAKMITAMQKSRARHPGQAHYDNPLSSVQGSLAELLGLDFQLNDLDYAGRNFVHADITLEELRNSVHQHNESFQQILLRSFKSGASASGTDHDLDGIENLSYLHILLHGPTARERVLLRRLIAVNFKDARRMNEVLEGPGGSTLISLRNQRAMDVLVREVGKKRHHIAVLYGAAHMAGIEAMLAARYHLVMTGQRWVTAWDLRMPPEEAPAPGEKDSDHAPL